ncbi:MAG: hypothetical protein AAF502_14490 [Bacteroidota bacterium]
MKLDAKYRFLRRTSFFIICLMAFQAAFPPGALALTSGPTQPEFQSFEPVGTTQMVDLFSGDFTYNIPLFNLPGPNGGYPFNLSYKPESNIDAESGPFGLGWTINPGVINRQMRGLPDDADGSAAEADKMSITSHMKNSWTAGVNYGGGAEFFGFFDFSLGVSAFYNNYKGVGYSIKPGVGFHFVSEDGLRSGGFGLDMSLNSQEGVGLSPSMSLTDMSDSKYTSFSVGLGINSRQGLTDMGLAFSGGDQKKEEKSQENASEQGDNAQPVADPDDAKKEKPDNPFSVSRSASISFANQSHSPKIDMPWLSTNFSLSFKLGGSFWGLFPNGYVSGFYSSQRFLKNGKTIHKPIFGYLNHHKSLQNDNALLDFNRTKDGPIREVTPNLPIPNTTPDVYALSGQGVGGMFRAYRSDVGILHDNKVLSFGGGGSISGEALFMHGGFDGKGNITIANSGKWSYQNGLTGQYDFVATGDGLYEPAYFKTQGESVTERSSILDDYIGGSSPMRANLLDHSAGLNYFAKGASPNTSLTGERTERQPRNMANIPLTNEELHSNTSLNEFQIQHYNGYEDFKTPPSTVFDVENYTNRKPHHIGGFISYEPSGLRYNYGIAAYNNVHEERVFSHIGNDCDAVVDINTTGTGIDEEVDYDIAGSDKFFRKTELPAYAHAYLLTSVLGTDYIDVNDNGPDEADLGYWVKFSYTKLHDDFMWRAPYHGANFMEGYEAKQTDDKASFLYGEKEIWALARVETRTHVAIFEMSDRSDGIEAAGRFANSGIGTLKLQQVDNIKLYTRHELENASTPVPIQTIDFTYGFDLCKGTPNSIGTNSGKLTLKELSFKYENSNRGALNPYEFHYDGENYDYSENRHDRWGIYKEPRNGEECNNLGFPYTEQFDHTWASEKVFEKELAKRASAWSLSKITLPSGATIDIDYEPKSYGHVQNRVATQMTRIVSFQDRETEPFDDDDNNGIVDGNDVDLQLCHDCTLPEDRKVYFELEHRIPTTATPDEKKALMDAYFKDLQVNPETRNKQVYYSVKLKHKENGNLYQTVSGYADVLTGVYGSNYGIDESLAYNGDYIWGYVTLAPARVGDNEYPEYHPFSLAYWQFMRTDMSELAFNAGTPSADEPVQQAQIRQTVRSLIAPFNDIAAMFKGYYKYCRAKGFAKQMVQSKSFIRLNSPDEKKYGGGVRVKKIVLDDHWSASENINEPNTLGQVFEYEGGVAAYEPLIGGDEIALREPRNYTESVPLRTDNQLYFEYPVNESYFPGPKIGYEKVTVKALATYMAGLNNDELSDEFALVRGSGPGELPYGISTTGKVVNEFYTAKDFPVITDQTEVDKTITKRSINTLVFGSSNTSFLTASQGYSIELNDMHGKVRKVSNFAQAPDGSFSEEPESWTRYNYKHDTKVVNSKLVKVPNSKVEVLLSNDEVETSPGSQVWELPTEDRMIGVDYEVFNDMRQAGSVSFEAGAQSNVDGIILPFFGITIPLPSVLPEVNFSESRVRTTVTNKVIHRTGVMESTEAFQNGSYVKTENLLYDAKTGGVLLSKVKNNYNDDIYNYSIPGHYVYDGMGPAYENLGMHFEAFVVNDEQCSGLMRVSVPIELTSSLAEGDEFYAVDIAAETDFHVTYVKQEGGEFYFAMNDFDLEGQDPGVLFNFKLTRSGKRNHLSATVGSITAKSDPTKNRIEDDCLAAIPAPAIVVNPAEPIYHLEINPDFWNLEVEPTSGHWDAIEMFNWAISQTNLSIYTCGFQDKEMVDLEDYPSYGNLNPNITPYTYFTDLLRYGCIGSPVWNGAPYFVGPVNYTFYQFLQEHNITSDNLTSVSVLGLDPNNPTPTSMDNSILDQSYVICEFHFIDEFGQPQVVQYPIAKAANFRSVRIVETIGSVNSLDLVEENRTIDYKTIDNVLATSAATFSDDWTPNNKTIDDNLPSGESLDAINPYKSGQKGIWRPERSYAYIADRNQEGDQYASVTTVMETTIDLANDGTFDAMPIFDYNNPFFSECNGWEFTGEMTKYGSEAELENRDALGQYSAAIYGYKDNLVVAVGANTRYSEMGFEGFEEFSDGNLATLSTNQVQGIEDFHSGNIDIIPVEGVLEVYDHFPVEIGKEDLVVIDKPFSLDWQPAEVELFIEMENGVETSFIATVDEFLPAPDGRTGLDLNFTPECNPTVGTGVLWKGRLVAARETIEEGCYVPATASVSSNRAHTGSKSLKIEAPGNSFNQETLDLIPGKEYVISMWVSQEDINQHDFDNNNIIAVNGNTIHPKGAVIEGWQRMEAKFTATHNNGFLFLVGTTWYIDDIRIFPADGNMQSYVYDPQNYRLMATLDNNNYATFYQYDPQGNVNIIKKETERGIVTIQENQSFVKEQQ